MQIAVEDAQVLGELWSIRSELLGVVEDVALVVRVAVRIDTALDVLHGVRYGQLVVDVLEVGSCRRRNVGDLRAVAGAGIARGCLGERGADRDRSARDSLFCAAV